MKITKIKLNNIGPYRGDSNILNLNTSKEKNIVLIGGKNGAGKTTLLNSIKIGLFGTYAYGLKTNSNQYYNSLNNMFNYVEARKKVSYYDIEIQFILIENYMENIYTFSRSWKKVADNVSEILRVKRNNIYISEEEIEQIQTKLKEIMPPAVIDTMLFDGEKIAQIIDDNNISSYLREIIKVNFNLNIFDKMEDDVIYYIEKEKGRKVFSADEINLLDCKNKYNENQKNLKNLKDIYDKYVKTIEEYKFKLKNLIKKFENYGGLNEKDKFAMRSSLEFLEMNRKKNISIIKEFLEDDIVFYLNYSRIIKIKKSIELEKPLLLLKYANEIGLFLGNDYINNIKSKLNSMIAGSDSNVKYSSTPKLEKIINDVITHINEISALEIKMILKNSREDLNNTKIYKKIIGNNENANSVDLQQLLKEIKILEVSIDDIKVKIKEVDRDIKRAEDDVNSSLIELETLEKKMDSEIKEENSFNIARKLLKVSAEYKNKQVKEYLNKIAELAVKKFDEINKKENYITKIIIDKESYNIVLYDNNDIEKDITILSAGEKQLLISAIVWSIFKLSDRNNLFTFDTPLARLDKENRTLFVEKILCTISDQVLILSTDEEIVGSLFKIVKSKISENYILINDENLGRTEIKEDYF